MAGPTDIQLDPNAVSTPRQPGVATPRVYEPQVTTPQLAELPSPLREVSNSLAKASDESNQVAQLYAKQAGYQAVTRDDQGNLVVAQAPIVGDAAIAFHSAVKFQALTMGESEAKREDLVLSRQFHDNPDGYLQAAQAFRDKHVQQYRQAVGEDVAAALGRSIDSNVTQNYRWLVLEQQRNIKQQFNQGTLAKLTSLDQDITSYIESGGKMSDPAVQNLIKQYVGTTQQRVQNPVLGESPDVAALRLKTLDLKINGASFVQGINRILQDPAGGIQAAQQAIDSHMQEKGVAPAQRTLDYAEGQKAIKDYQQNLERSVNLANKAKKLSDEQQEDRIIQDAASPNPTITENDIKTNPAMSPEAKMRMLGWIKRDGMPEPLAQVSQAASMDLFRRMNLPEGDPQRIGDLALIRNAYINGQLKRQDEEWLEQRFKEARTPEGEKLQSVRSQFSKAVEPTIDKSNPLMGKIDQDGKLNNYRFERFVDDKVNEYRKAGKSPYDLFDPAKADYLGKPEILQQYQKTVQQSAEDAARRFTRTAPAQPGAPPRPQRQPGESIDAYMKRTGQGVP